MIISSVDLSNVTRISIHWNMLCSQNMLFMFSSFVNSTQVNDTLPSSSVGRLYRTNSTLLVSLGLTPWLNSLSWSLRPLNVTPRHRTFNLWGSPPLNCAWTSIHPPLFQIYTIRNWKQSMKNSFQHFIKHLECKLYINPKNKKNNPKMFCLKKNIKIKKITLKCFP